MKPIRITDSTIRTIQQHDEKVIAQTWDYCYAIENIEEKLGIDLITLFKVMKADKIFFKKYHSYYENDGVDIETKSIYGFGEHSPNMVSALLKDYGKTWSLRKEDLK